MRGRFPQRKKEAGLGSLASGPAMALSDHKTLGTFPLCDFFLLVKWWGGVGHWTRLWSTLLNCVISVRAGMLEGSLVSLPWRVVISWGSIRTHHGPLWSHNMSEQDSHWLALCFLELWSFPKAQSPHLEHLWPYLKIRTLSWVHTIYLSTEGGRSLSLRATWL